MRDHEKKRILVEYFGGKCMFCGYHTSEHALIFRHPLRKEKNQPARLFKTHTLKSLKEVLKSFALLCLNCNARVTADELFIDYDLVHDRVRSITDVAEKTQVSEGKIKTIKEITIDLDTTQVVETIPTELRNATQPRIQRIGTGTSQSLHS